MDDYEKRYGRIIRTAELLQSARRVLGVAAFGLAGLWLTYRGNAGLLQLAGDAPTSHPLGLVNYVMSPAALTAGIGSVMQAYKNVSKLISERGKNKESNEKQPERGADESGRIKAFARSAYGSAFLIAGLPILLSAIAVAGEGPLNFDIDSLLVLALEIGGLGSVFTGLGLLPDSPPWRVQNNRPPSPPSPSLQPDQETKRASPSEWAGRFGMGLCGIGYGAIGLDLLYQCDVDVFRVIGAVPPLSDNRFGPILDHLTVTPLSLIAGIGSAYFARFALSELHAEMSGRGPKQQRAKRSWNAERAKLFTQAAFGATAWLAGVALKWGGKGGLVIKILSALEITKPHLSGTGWAALAALYGIGVGSKEGGKRMVIDASDQSYAAWKQHGKSPSSSAPSGTGGKEAPKRRPREAAVSPPQPEGSPNPTG